jgi:hypothetical protein
VRKDYTEKIKQKTDLADRQLGLVLLLLLL